MKKYRVTDEDGNALTVEELETSTADEKCVEHDEDEMLTSDEIKALKNLAKVADKLVSLVETKTDDEEEIEEEKEEEEEIIDTDEESVEEEIVKKTSHDSKKGFAAIEKKKKEISDSALDHELEVAQAWAKRYGGK